MNYKNEKEAWESTSALLEDYKVEFGHHWAFNFRNDPKRLAFVLSRYKFAAKMACKRGGSVLEMGCSEGIGSTILAENMTSYLGVDLDEPAIHTAQKNLTGGKLSFLFDDFMGKKYGSFDAVVSLDVVEHILPEFEPLYFETIFDNLSSEGICIIGTPNITSVAHASSASQLGHVNMFTQERLQDVLRQYFHYVLPFGMNDEIVHTGFSAMSHYLLCVAFHKKEG